MRTMAQAPAVCPLATSTLPEAEWTYLRETRHHNPHTVLGPHRLAAHGDEPARCVIRVHDPYASSAQVRFREGEAVAMQSWQPGCFELAWLGDTLPAPDDYTLELSGYVGDAWSTADPYAFSPTIGDVDLYLFGEGNHNRIYNVLGAHPQTHQGVAGTRFAVWAPNAERVSVTGTFNRWDGRRHPMRMLGTTGVWELFIPEVAPGALYKLEIRSRKGALIEKTDPYGRAFELRPGNAAIVTALDGYAWSDHEWMQARRGARATAAPLNIYEVHLGSWMRDEAREGGFLGYRELAERLVTYCTDMGYTHVELLPVAEHPFDGSWGYQVTGYYAPTSRHGSPHDFMAFVDRLHAAGIGVIADWVPAHFPRDAWALGRFDGTAVYEHEDPRQGEHRDWGTFIFNFGRNEVRNFLVANALFWLDYYHLDGLRVDAVASMLYLDYSREPGDWIPNRYGGRENLEALDFLKHTNHLIHEQFPGVITLAEESTSWPAVTRPVYTGGLGFDFKWNMGWMNDFLAYMALDPIHRKFHHGKLTFAMMYACSEQFVLVLSHDEVVHGKRSLLDKMPGDDWQRFANLRLAYSYMMAHPGKKLLFMGGELGQWHEWHEGQAIHWHLLDWPLHAQLKSYVRELNHLYASSPALHQIEASWEGFSWIDCQDADNSVVSFLRKAEDPSDLMACVFNFTPLPRYQYRIGVPREGWYREVLNSDSQSFGGSNLGNMGGVQAEAIPAHGQPWSVSLTLPPLGGIYLVPDPLPAPETGDPQKKARTRSTPPSTAPGLSPGAVDQVLREATKIAERPAQRSSPRASTRSASTGQASTRTASRGQASTRSTSTGQASKSRPAQGESRKRKPGDAPQP